MKRLECLDGLRGVLALYVLLTHMAPFAALPAWIVWLLSHGEAAVDVFFVLSGLVIVRSLEHYDYRVRPFLIARVARIFPVFLPVFAFAVLVQPVAIDFVRMPWIGPDSPARAIWSDGWPAAWVAELAAHLTMLHGLFPNAVLPDAWVSFLGAAWSLSTEWQFYALVALIGARLGRGEDGRWRLVLLLLGIALAGLAWRTMTPPGWWFSRAFLPNKAMYFALGVASAGLIEDPRRWPRFVIVVGVALLLCLRQDNPLKVMEPFVWVVCLAAQAAQGRSGDSWYGLRGLGSLLCSPSLRRLGAISVLAVPGERADPEAAWRGAGAGGGWRVDAVHRAVGPGRGADSPGHGVVVAFPDRSAGPSPRQDAGTRRVARDGAEPPLSWGTPTPCARFGSRDAHRCGGNRP